MSHGLAQGRLTALFALLFAATFFSRSVASPAPASAITVTLLSWNRGQIQVQGEDGRVFALAATAATWILRRGLPAGTRDFAPGETLQVRLGRGAKGMTRALLVCDPETAEALTARRGQPLVGTLLSAAGKVWIVQPDDGSVPLPVCLSSHTTFQAGEVTVASAAFTVGARVTVKTRRLPNGLPSAVAVTDGIASEKETSGQAASEKEKPHPRKTFSGTVGEARPDLGLLTLQDKSGVSQTIAVDSQTLIRVRSRKSRRPGTWNDLTVGRPIFARFAGTEDTDGNPKAVSLSVSGP